MNLDQNPQIFIDWNPTGTVRKPVALEHSGRSGGVTRTHPRDLEEHGERVYDAFLSKQYTFETT